MIIIRQKEFNSAAQKALRRKWDASLCGPIGGEVSSKVLNDPKRLQRYQIRAGRDNLYGISVDPLEMRAKGNAGFSVKSLAADKGRLEPKSIPGPLSNITPTLASPQPSAVVSKVGVGSKNLTNGVKRNTNLLSKCINKNLGKKVAVGAAIAGGLYAGTKLCNKSNLNNK